MVLRDYANTEVRAWHDYTLRLLGTLHDEYGIAVEIDRIDEQHGAITDFPGEVRSLTTEEVYERDLKRNRALNQSIDQTPSEAFKHYGKLDTDDDRSKRDPRLLVPLYSLQAPWSSGVLVVDGPCSSRTVECRVSVQNHRRPCPL